MRIQSLILLVILGLTMSALHAQKQVNIPGFGTLPVTKSGDNYKITLDKYGTFDFKGTLSPFDLETSVKVDQLKKFPGYDVMANLGLKDIKLKVSSAGLFIGAKADTKKNLQVLFDFLNVKAPYVTINTKISKTSFALESILDFSREPVIAKVIPPAGTELHVEKISMLAGAGTGGANISVITEARMKPTKWDPALKTKFELSYNLRNQEISGSGSMIDTWADPFALDKHLKKNSISFTNTAVSFGWVIGAPSPTTLGFAVENAKFFNLEFGTMMSISPANGQIALKASRPKMTMNDFSRILREGFGLNVPDVFPNNVYIRDAEILYSPNGGEIGEVEIEQGFAMKGKANLLGAVKADIDYYANWEDGFYLDYKLNADLKEALMKEIRKVKPLAPVMSKVLSTFQLRKVHTHLEAGMDMNMSGETHVEFEVFGKTHKFDMKATLDPEAIMDAIIDKILENSEMMKIAGQVADLAGDAGKKAMGIVNGVKSFAGEYSDDIAHLHHSMNKCNNECIPKLANKLANPVLKGSDKAVLEFYHSVYPEITRVVGENQNETKKLRRELIGSEWTKLANQIKRKWEDVITDGTCKGYKCKCDKYKRLVREKRATHKKLRLRLYQSMMTDVDNSNKYNVYRIYSVGKDGFSWNIWGKHYAAKTTGAKLRILKKEDNGADRFIKVINNDKDGLVMFQPQHSEKIVRIHGGSDKPGVHMKLWHKKNAPDRRFKLIEVPGRTNTYFIETKDGLFLTAGDLITQEKPVKSENQMWYFKKAYTSDMLPPPNGKYRIRTLAGKNLYIDIPGGGKNARGKRAKIQLWTLDHHPDRTIEIKKRKAGLYTLQPLHSKYVFDVAGRSKSNGAAIALWDYKGSSNQLFEFIYAGAPGVYNIKISHSGKFVDASGGKINQKGDAVHQWKGHNGDNQKWKLEPVGQKWAKPPKHQSFYIRPAYSKKYWDLGGDGAATNKKGKRFKLWTLNNGGDRKYKFKPTGDHSWLNIEVQNGGRRVDCKGAKVKSNGTPLHLWDAHGGDAQKFAVKPTSKHTFVLFSKGYKAVDVKGGKIHDNGAELHLWSKHYGPSQQWVLEYASGPNKGKLYEFKGF